MAKSQANPLKLVGGRNPSLNYAPPQRINHAVEGVEWPFVETRKGPDDVVISAIVPKKAPVARKRGWFA